MANGNTDQLGSCKKQAVSETTRPSQRLRLPYVLVPILVYAVLFRCGSIPKLATAINIVRGQSVSPSDR